MVFRKDMNHLFMELDAHIRAKGLLDRHPYFYICHAGIITGLMVLSMWILATIHLFWVQMANAAFLAFIFGQIGFLSHDLGHGQITGGRWYRFLNKCSSAILGWNLGWWVYKHNQHHAFPNQMGKDPDIDLPPVAFYDAQAAQKKNIWRVTTRYQAVLFLPLLLFEVYNIRAASIVYLMRKKAGEKYEGLFLMGMHAGIYISLLLFFLPVGWAMIFMLVHWGLLGLYLGLAFAPNHKGMPIVRTGERLGFLEHQAYTTRNVRGGWLTDILTGGLNYQIEHHLWPAMSRGNLKKAAPIVETFCRERNIPYHTVGIGGSYGEIFRHFSRVGVSLKS